MSLPIPESCKVQNLCQLPAALIWLPGVLLHTTTKTTAKMHYTILSASTFKLFLTLQKSQHEPVNCWSAGSEGKWASPSNESEDRSMPSHRSCSARTQFRNLHNCHTYAMLLLHRFSIIVNARFSELIVIAWSMVLKHLLCFMPLDGSLHVIACKHCAENSLNAAHLCKKCGYVNLGYVEAGGMTRRACLRILVFCYPNLYLWHW